MNSAKIDPLDAELLIAHVLNKPREWVLANPDGEVIKLKVIKFIKLTKQRERGVPLAYLTGHKEFFGLDFEVNKSVLVPRPETETMVEIVIKEIEEIKKKFKKEIKEIFLIDVGTGSGCIPISILKNLPHNFSPYQGEREGVCIKTIAVDISKQASIIAKRNAKKHGVKIKFLHGDLLAPVIARRPLPTRQSNHQQIIITANLPYLTNKQYQSSPSIHHEPRLALVAKNNGLALYEKLLKQIRQLLKIENCKLKIFLEIDPSQSTPITCLIKSILPGAKTQIIKDLSNRDRVVQIRVN